MLLPKSDLIPPDRNLGKSPSPFEFSLHLLEAIDEFAIGFAQRFLGFNIQKATQIHNRKQQIANLYFDFLLTRFRYTRLQFLNFFIELRKHIRNAVPIETDAGSFALNLLRSEQTRQMVRNPIEGRFPVFIAYFTTLDLLPVF